MHNNLITQTIKELILSMGLDCEAVDAVEASSVSHPRFVLRSKDSALLIGTQGEHLSALNAVARRLVAKKMPPGAEPVKFFVDVNGYFENTVKSLEMKAKIMAERARSFKASVEMEPMSPYERMIIHAALESVPDVKTESTGFGKNRRVVIRPVEPEAR